MQRALRFRDGGADKRFYDIDFRVMQADAVPCGRGAVADPPEGNGEDVALTLETPSGTVHIEGETILSTHDVYHDDKMFSSQALKQEMPSFPALQQAGVRYRWDGEEAFGMLERSNPLDQLIF
jgi:hypothetical protein